MRRILRTFSALFLAMLMCATALAQNAGVVAVGEGDCKKSDRVVIATRSGFTLGEQWSGFFSKDDRVFGDLNSYGFKDVKVGSSNGRLYIDDFMASEDRAKEWCFEED
jgi:hypothetical protein